jgi:hypothetical protein
MVLLQECGGSIGEEVEGKGRFLQGTPREAERSSDQG